MYKYNYQHKILFIENPFFQCVLGQFAGWMLVLGVYGNSINVNKDELKTLDIKFKYNSLSKYNKLADFIKKSLKEN
jgi:hypothetical protein